MPIISHRGARGLAPENSIESIKIADSFHPLFIEFDVRMASDKKLAVIHNGAINGQLVSDMPYAKLKKLVNAPLLSEAVLAISNSRPLIELKVANIATDCYTQTKKSSAAYASFIYDALFQIRQLDSTKELYIMQRLHPLGLLKKAKLLNAQGIGLNKNWLLLLPLFYMGANKAGLVIYIYTVNSRYLAAFLKTFFPKIIICTDYPNKII
jgi:glycerophosphoryl diester phosphodiesterase